MQKKHKSGFFSETCFAYCLCKGFVPRVYPGKKTHHTTSGIKLSRISHEELLIFIAALSDALRSHCHTRYGSGWKWKLKPAIFCWAPNQSPFFPVVYFRVVPSGFVFCVWAEQHSSPQVFFKRMTNAMPNYGAQQGAERGLSDRCTGSQREVNQCLSKNGMVPANEISKYRQKIEK